MIGCDRLWEELVDTADWRLFDVDRCEDNPDISARPKGYLRDEYMVRLGTGKPVTFTLQAQFHDIKPDAEDEAKPGGDSRWYNPTSPWYNSAWIDLASISLYSSLPQSNNEGVFFCADCVPSPAICIPDPADETDFNSVAAVEGAMEAERMAAVASKEAAEEGLAPSGDDRDLEMTDYLIYCVTGERLNAGTNASIHISIVGKPPSSEKPCHSGIRTVCFYLFIRLLYLFINVIE